MSLKTTPFFYRCLSFGEPVKIRPALRENEPCHIDMLRYDLGFCHPEDPSLIVLPIFKHPKNGRHTNQITAGRWRSFGLELKPIGPELPNDARYTPDEWVGYKAVGMGQLEKHTMHEFMQEQKLKIVGYR